MKQTLPDTSGFIPAVKAMLLASEGDRRGAERMIAVARQGRGFGHFHHTSYAIACAYSLMGRSSEAIQWLQDSADDGFPNYPLFEKDSTLAPLRGDARFREFMARLRMQWEKRQREL